jgi:predicted lipoprotein with Yx(FWY)xxD motif
VNKTTYGFALLALVAVLAVAGCGSSSNSSTTGGSETSASSGGAYGGESETSSSSSGRYGGGESSNASAESPPGAESGVAVLTVSNAKKVGPVLVNAKGFTVYDFHKDKGTTSSCYGACAAGWPPVLTEGNPTAGEGAMASKLGTTERKDGTTQVTYAGHPLYTFVEDKKPGEANGNDVSAFGAQWYALKGSGEEAGD